MAVVEDLDERLRQLKGRAADAQRRRAQHASNAAVRQDRLAQIEARVQSQFGVSIQEAPQKLAELRAELQEKLEETELRLGEVGQSGG